MAMADWRQWTPNPHAGQGIVVGCIKQRGGGFLSSVVTRAVPQSSWSLRCDVRVDPSRRRGPKSLGHLEDESFPLGSSAENLAVFNARKQVLDAAYQEGAFCALFRLRQLAEFPIRY